MTEDVADAVQPVYTVLCQAAAQAPLIQNADILMSVMETCVYNDINPWNDLVAIQEYQADVRKNPLLWVPWAHERDGTRRFTHVTEVAGMEGEVITLQDIFLFDFSAGLDEEGRFRGRLKSTGLRPKFIEKLEERGVRVDPELFALEAKGR